MRALLVTAGVAVLVALLGSIVALRNADRIRPRLEAAASKAFCIRVRVGGPIRLGFGRGIVVQMERVHVEGSADAVLASVDEAKLWVQPLALLRGAVRLRRIELVRPSISVQRQPDGTTHLEGLRCPEALLRALEGASASVSGANVRYADSTSGIQFAAFNVGLSTGALRFANQDRPFDLRMLAMTASLTCDSVRNNAASASAIRLALHADNGVRAMSPFTLNVLGGHASGSLRIDLTSAEPRYALRGSLRRFRVEQLLGLQGGSPAVRGSMDLVAHVVLSGSTAGSLLRSSAGTVSLRGSHLTLVGDDLDRRLSRFESSQGFGFVDVGAAVLAGPVGLAVTRSYRIASLLRGSGDDSPIEALSSDWRLDQGVARARDVAMATRRHRITLRGDLDFVRSRYANVTVAIVDAHGCATAQQVMNGDFAHPVVQRPHLLTSVAGPVLHLYRQARAVLPGCPCENSYAGSVAPPE